MTSFPPSPSLFLFPLYLSSLHLSPLTSLSISISLSTSLPLAFPPSLPLSPPSLLPPPFPPSLPQEFVSVAEDLRICTVKYADDLDRRFCFEVVTPSRSCLLQADSEALRKKWYTYLEAGIARALRISASNRVCTMAFF